MSTLWMPKKDRINSYSYAKGIGDGSLYSIGVIKNKWNFQTGVEFKNIAIKRIWLSPFGIKNIEGKVSFFSIPFQFGYTFSKLKKMKCYLTGGGSFLNESTRSKFSLVLRENDSTISGSLFFPLKYTINLGFGLSRSIHKHFDLFATYRFEFIKNDYDLSKRNSHGATPIQVVFNITNFYSGATVGINYNFIRNSKM